MVSDDEYTWAEPMTADFVDEMMIAGLGSENLEAYQDFVDVHTSKKVPLDIESMWAVMGLAAEAGEVLAEFEKGIRKDDFETRREAILEELGDVLWYAAALCNAYDTTLEEVMVNNCRKLEQRVSN